MDHLTKEKRSWNMSRIRSKNTKPEMVVRSLLYSMGYRFRLHGRVNKKLYKPGVLPGKPDIVLKKYRTVIFIHGCFWHRHENCKKASTPKTRTEWWQAKFDRNVANDRKHQQELKDLGWKVVVIWECEIKNLELRNVNLEKKQQVHLLQERLKRELTLHAYEQSDNNQLMIAAEEEK
jgi:DNA mismatch endonuclease, patch repair protein